MKSARALRGESDDMKDIARARTTTFRNNAYVGFIGR